MNSSNESNTPKISVVVASKVGAPFIDQCLESVEAEARELGAEVIVVASGSTSYVERLENDFPWVKVVHSKEVTKVPALRRIGVEEARGEIIAVIEEHCSAKEDWLKKTEEAFQAGDFGSVGGPIVDYDYKRLRDWVVYFCEYNGALPPFVDGPTTNLNDANIAYPRQLLIENLQLLDEGYWPMTLHPHLLANGVRLQAANDMVVYHRGPFDFGYYLGQRFLFSKAYTGVRAQSKSIIWRLAYLLGAPLIPLMLFLRIAMRVFKQKCKIGKFILSIPLIITALVVLVAGEWLGCLVGPGDALSKVE